MLHDDKVISIVDREQNDDDNHGEDAIVFATKLMMAKEWTWNNVYL